MEDFQILYQEYVRGKCSGGKAGGDHFFLLLWRNDLRHVFGTEYMCVIRFEHTLFVLVEYLCKCSFRFECQFSDFSN